MKKNKKIKAFPKVKVAETDYRETMEVISTLDIPFSQLAREAIHKYIAELKRTDPRLNKAHTSV